MMNFAPRNKRNSGVDDFQQMHDSVESLDFLDLEGLEEYAGGKSKTDATKEPTNSTIAPLSLSPGKSLAKTLSLADRKSNTSKRNLSPPSIDGDMEKVVKKDDKTRRGGKREAFKRAQSEKGPSRSPTKDRSSRTLGRKEAPEQTTSTNGPSEQATKSPRSPSRIRAVLRRNTSNDTEETVPPFFQQMNDSCESFDFLDLQGLDEKPSETKDKQKSSSNLLGGERAGALAALRQSVANTFLTPGRKRATLNKDNMSKRSLGAPQLDNLESPDNKHKNSGLSRERSRRSMTPFRRTRSQDSENEQATKTPKGVKSKLRSITPFRREPTGEEESKTNKVESKSKRETKRITLSPFKRTKSKKRIDRDESLSAGLSIENNETPSQTGSKDDSTQETAKHNTSQRRLKSELSSRSLKSASSKQPRPATPPRGWDRNEKVSSPNEKSESKLSMHLESPRNKKSKSSDSRRSKKYADADCASRCSKQSVKKGSSDSAKRKDDSKPKKISDADCSRSVCTTRTATSRISTDSSAQGSAATKPARRRRTKTPMRRRQPAPEVEKPEKATQPQDDDSSTSSSSSGSSGSSSDSTSMSDNRSKDSVQIAVAKLEKSIDKVEKTPGSKGADVATFISEPKETERGDLTAYQRPGAFNDMSWIKDSKETSTGAGHRRSVSTGRQRQKSGTQPRSKSTGRTSALASATLLPDAPPTPRSRNRVADRRGSTNVNDCASLLTASSRRTASSRGKSSRGAARARREASEMRSLPSIVLQSS